jgi:isopenicillin N synthase-like dioxygenase
LPYDYFSRFHTAKEDIFRFTKYTPPDFPLVETDMGAGAHSDFGSLTLLYLFYQTAITVDSRMMLEVSKS